MKCSKCGGDMLLDESKILTSPPVQREYKCDNCGNIQCTTECDYSTTKQITDNGFNKPLTQQGWQCLVCGAVMAPWCSSCINCTGHKSITVTDIDSTPGYPYPLFPQTICKTEG